MPHASRCRRTMQKSNVDAVFAVAGRKPHASLQTPFRSEGLQQRGRREPIEEWARERCVQFVELARSVFCIADRTAAVCWRLKTRRKRFSFRDAPAAAARREGDTSPQALEVGGMMTAIATAIDRRSEEHTSELQSHVNLVCRLLLEKKKQ